jgi:energy-coupling factor transport system ATP-binding protein
MMALIRRLNEAGHTIIIITHAMDIAAGWARRVILIEAGRIVRDGSTRTVFAEEERIRSLGLRPPPIVQVGNRLGVPAVTLDELVSCLTRAAEPPNRRTPGQPA